MNLRVAEPGDWGWIYANFVSSFRAATVYSDGMTGREIASLLTNLVMRGWQVMVAEMEGVLAGWVLYSTDQRLGWIFTRAMFRGSGLSLLLLERAGIDPRLPVISPFVANRLKDKCPLRLNIRFRPYLATPPVENAATH